MACLTFYKVLSKVLCICFALLADCHDRRLCAKKSEKFRYETIGKPLNPAEFLFLFFKNRD